LGPSDTIVVTGASQSGATAYNADGTSFGTITNDGGSDAIVVKYTSGGTIQWIARIASTTTDTAEAVVCDPSGAIYVGAFGANSSQAVTVFNADGTSFSTQPLPTSLALGDGYIVKYSSTGGAQWCARYASAGSDRPKGMALDSDGNLYFVGEASRPIFYNADGTSNRGTLMTAQGQMGFLAKYTSAGVCMWSFGFDATGNDITYAVATDRRNNVYVGGLHNTSGGNGTLLDIDYRAVLYPGPWNAMKFTSHGLLQWFQTLRGTTVFATVYGVAIDFDCNLIVVGSGPTGETLNIYARA
jgi:hypothetical protein